MSAATGDPRINKTVEINLLENSKSLIFPRQSVMLKAGDDQSMMCWAFVMEAVSFYYSKINPKNTHFSEKEILTKYREMKPNEKGAPNAAKSIKSALGTIGQRYGGAIEAKSAPNQNLPYNLEPIKCEFSVFKNAIDASHPLVCVFVATLNRSNEIRHVVLVVGYGYREEKEVLIVADPASQELKAWYFDVFLTCYGGSRNPGTLIKVIETVEKGAIENNMGVLKNQVQH